MTNFLDKLTAISTMLTAIAAAAAAFIAFFQTRAASKIAKSTADQAMALAKFNAELQSVQHFDTQWQSDRMIKVRRGAAAALLREEPSVDVDEVLDFFEEIARLVKRGILPIETAWDAYYWPIANYWAKSAAYAQEARDDEGASWTNLPEVLTRLQQVESKESDRPINAVSPREAQTRVFLEGETKLELL